jgi:hypothetical protein
VLERPERSQDPRLIGAQIAEDAGDDFPKGTWLLGVSPVKLRDDRLVYWPSPQPIAFNLIEAKRARDRGARARRSILSQLERRADGAYSPPNPTKTLDAIRDLQGAVLAAFTAIESLANHAIDSLIEGRGERFEVERPDGHAIVGEDLFLRFRLDEKLKRILPLVDGGRNIAGTAAWEDYLMLKLLRDELVHVKRRGINSDPETPTAYDRLLLGEGDDCVERALRVIDGAWSDFLPEHVRSQLR